MSFAQSTALRGIGWMHYILDEDATWVEVDIAEYPPEKLREMGPRLDNDILAWTRNGDRMFVKLPGDRRQ